MGFFPSSTCPQRKKIPDGALLKPTQYMAGRREAQVCGLCVCFLNGGINSIKLFYSCVCVCCVCVHQHSNT